jgi:hypothetical protein
MHATPRLQPVAKALVTAGDRLRNGGLIRMVAEDTGLPVRIRRPSGPRDPDSVSWPPPHGTEWRQWGGVEERATDRAGRRMRVLHIDARWPTRRARSPR